MRFVSFVLILCLLYSVKSPTPTCRKTHANTGSTPDYSRLSELLSRSIDYTTDPCADFYHFACRNRNANVSFAEETHHTAYRTKMYEVIKAAILTNQVVMPSKAVMAAQRFYKRCLARNSERQIKGGPVQYLLEKIKLFGKFPLLDNGTDCTTPTYYNKSALTDLLIYFSKSRVPMDVIVPHVSLYLNHTEPFLKFSHAYMLEFVKSHKDQFHKMLLKMAILLCLDNNSICYTQKLIRDIGEVEEFFQTITRFYYDSIQSPGLQKLKDVIDDMPLIDWLKYLQAVAPPNVHKIFNENLPVLVKLSVTPLPKKVNKLLESTRRDTITNFVMLHYILSWTELLDQRYRDLLKDLPKASHSEEDICFVLTKKRFAHALLAGYAEITEGEETKNFVVNIFEELREAFTDLINENEILSSEAKKALISKVTSMNARLAFDDLHLGNFQKLDSFYRDQVEALNRNNTEFFELEDIFGEISRKTSYGLLTNATGNAEDVYRTLFNLLDFTIAINFRVMNKVVCGPGFLQFPTFARGMPRSYLYGSVGAIFAHEIMHGFDSIGIMRDEKGNRSWLPKEFKHEYNKREACLKRKYSNSEVPGTYLKPRGGLTVEEDFADSEGVKLAYRAYKNAQKHFVNEPRLSDVSDLTSDQLFFIGWASFFCRNLGEDNREMINMLKEDYYSVPILRVNNPLSNMPEFAEAFHCPPRSPMNAPERRCRLLL